MQEEAMESESTPGGWQLTVTFDFVGEAGRELGA